MVQFKLVVGSLTNVLDNPTTLTGRQIAKHMASKVNEVITGTYDHVGQAIIYGDTDLAYFSHMKFKKKLKQVRFGQKKVLIQTV